MVPSLRVKRRPQLRRDGYLAPACVLEEATSSVEKLRKRICNNGVCMSAIDDVLAWPCLQILVVRVREILRL